MWSTLQRKHPADSYLLTLAHTLLCTSSGALMQQWGARHNTEIGDLRPPLPFPLPIKKGPRPGLCFLSVQTVTCNLKKWSEDSANEKPLFSKILTTGHQAKSNRAPFSTQHHMGA
jgi:hypothetical protein